METLTTLQRQSRIALEDVRTQVAICNELNKKVTAEPSLADVLKKANERLELLKARWSEAGDAAWAVSKKKFFPDMQYNHRLI
jgi:hypothetical protein